MTDTSVHAARPQLVKLDAGAPISHISAFPCSSTSGYSSNLPEHLNTHHTSLNQLATRYGTSRARDATTSADMRDQDFQDYYTSGSSLDHPNVSNPAFEETQTRQVSHAPPKPVSSIYSRVPYADSFAVDFDQSIGSYQHFSPAWDSTAVGANADLNVGAHNSVLLQCFETTQFVGSAQAHNQIIEPEQFAFKKYSRYSTATMLSAPEATADPNELFYDLKSPSSFAWGLEFGQLYAENATSLLGIPIEGFVADLHSAATSSEDNQAASSPERHKSHVSYSLLKCNIQACHLFSHRSQSRCTPTFLNRSLRCKILRNRLSCQMPEIAAMKQHPRLERHATSSLALASLRSNLMRKFAPNGPAKRNLSVI